MSWDGSTGLITGQRSRQDWRRHRLALCLGGSLRREILLAGAISRT
jgi:hypothetical protein